MKDALGEGFGYGMSNAVHPALSDHFPLWANDSR